MVFRSSDVACEAPRVSVVIPTYNRAGCLPRAIDSVLAQTFDDYEIIVIDDGSSDNTSEVLAAYGDRVCVVKQVNQGVSAARNHGIRVARGEFVAFLDSDDEWLPRKLEAQVQYLNSHSDVGFAGCLGYCREEDGTFFSFDENDRPEYEVYRSGSVKRQFLRFTVPFRRT